MSETVPATQFALVRMPVAPVHVEPRVSSPQTTQVPFGRVVVFGDWQGEWVDARTTPDGYRGWIHEGYLTRVDVPALADRADATRFLGEGSEPALRVSFGCTVRAGRRTLRLPLGAWIGSTDVVVLAGEAVPMGELAERCPPVGDAVVRTAQRYFDSTSYQWGGVTPWGADCSGFVQTVFALHGVDLPRDAWQQAGIGADAGRDLEAHAAGHLLFFSDRDDRRITHVGIAAGGGRMLHLALGRGGWADDDLLGDDAPYVARLRASFVGARRVLG